MNTKSVLITGAGTGIGAACAGKFAAEGYQVVLVGRREEALLKVADRLPHSPLVIPGDVGTSDFAQYLFTTLKSRNVKLTGIVNNAGIYEWRTMNQFSWGHWQSMFSINLFGTAAISGEACKRHEEHSLVFIVNVSSSLGLRTIAGTAAYSASKAAINSLTQTLALELAPLGIRVNAVCPGVVDTPIHDHHRDLLDKMGATHPVGRVGTPDEIAQAVWYLASPVASFTTGVLLPVDGGISLTQKG